MALASIVFMWAGFILLMVGIVYTFQFNAFLGILIAVTGVYLHVIGVRKIINESREE